MRIVKIGEKRTVFKHRKHVFYIDNKICGPIYDVGLHDGIYSTKMYMEKILKKFNKNIKKGTKGKYDREFTRRLKKYLKKNIKIQAVMKYNEELSDKENELDILLGKEKDGPNWKRPRIHP